MLVGVPVSAEGFFPLELSETNELMAVYNPCDVNHDGYVNMTDAMTVYRYLNGLITVSNYTYLDANRSLTVDMGDYYYIIHRLSGQAYNGAFYSLADDSYSVFPGYTTTETVFPYTPNTRSYKKYTYNSNTPNPITSYQLTPVTSTASLPNGDSVNTVVDGDDERVRAYGNENCGIVHLSIGGTGFIVDDHVIATAAHCLYNYNAHSFVQNLEIKTYNSNGELTETSLTPVEAHVPQEYIDNRTLGYDYGLITVEQDLSDYVHFSLGECYGMYTTGYNGSIKTGFNCIPVYATGCPAYYRLHWANGQYLDDTSYDNTEDNFLYLDQGKIIYPNSNYLNQNWLQLYFDAVISGGDSGAPLYTISVYNHSSSNPEYVYTALGIVTGGKDNAENAATRITEYQLRFYMNNPYIEYNENTQ